MNRSSISLAENREAELLRRGVFDPAEQQLRPTSEPEPEVCAWCDKENGIVRKLASNTSHGICKRHEAMMRREIEIMGDTP